MNVFGAAVRRERVGLPVWAAVAGLLAAATAGAVPQAYGDVAERRSLVELVTATPSLLALRGVPDGTTEGAFAFFEVFTYLALVAGLMSVFLVTRQTRADEDTGRAELMLSTPVHRRAPLVGALMLAAVGNVVLAGLVTAGLTAGGLPVGGSALTGAAAGTAGLAYAGVTAIVAQCAPSGRATNAIGTGVVVGTWALRAAGDALGTRSADGLTVASAWPSWLSPIGWGQQVFPYTRHDAWPLVLCVGVALVASAGALALRARRDLGASTVPERAGRASGRLRTSAGLAWRLHRSTVAAWAVGGALLGLFAGALGPTAVDALGSDRSVSALVQTLVPGGRGALLDEFVAAVLGIASVLAAAAGLGALTRATEEDRTGRSELILATPVSRVQRSAEWLGVAVVSAAIVVLAAGVLGGIGTAGSGRFWSTFDAGVVQLPAALVVVAVAALACTILPRASGWLVWVLLALAVVLGQFGGLLRVPDWARQVSPFTHTPGVPAAQVDWSGAWWMTAIAVVIGTISLVLARRQEFSP